MTSRPASRVTRDLVLGQHMVLDFGDGVSLWGKHLRLTHTHTEPMTVTELTLDQLQHTAGASSFTSNPVAAQEDMFASGR